MIYSMVIERDVISATVDWRSKRLYDMIKVGFAIAVLALTPARQVNLLFRLAAEWSKKRKFLSVKRVMIEYGKKKSKVA